MTLANDVQRLLDVFKHNFAAFLEASDLDLNYLTDTSLIISKVLDALVVLDDAGHAQIKTAENNAFLDVFYESKYIRVNIKSVHVRDIPIDESVANAFARITQYFVIQLGQTLVDFAAFTDIVNDVLVEHLHLPHFLVNFGEVLYILGSVLDHAGCEGSLLPKLWIILHQVVYLVLPGIVLAQVLLEQVVEPNVDVTIVVLLEEVCDQPMGYLGVEHEVTDQVILADHG